VSGGTNATRSYTAKQDASGEDTFTFKVSDGQKDSAVATVKLAINPRNQPPVAVPQAITVTAGEAKPITLVGSDAEQQALTYTVVEQPKQGTLSGGTGAARSYAAKPDASGEDSFTFKVSDGQKDSAVATVKLTINPRNQPPVATPQAVTVTAGEAKAITLAGSDPEKQALTYTVVEQPKQGTLSGGTGAARSYAAKPDASGEDSFTFKLNDGVQDSAVATVKLTINPRNQPPVAVPQAITVTAGEPKPITLAGSDAEKQALTYTVVEQPKKGTLSGGTGAARSYAAKPDAGGEDSFTFKVNDGVQDSQAASVSIAVTLHRPGSEAVPGTVNGQTATAKPQPTIQDLDRQFEVLLVQFRVLKANDQRLTTAEARKAEIMFDLTEEAKGPYRMRANWLKSNYERLQSFNQNDRDKNLKKLLEAIDKWP
jgi:hypothetical protein